MNVADDHLAAGVVNRVPMQVMGILNVTPDSFSDGGQWFAPQAAIAHGIEMFAQGAHVVDVGGESTRPGAEVVPLAEELRRVVAVIEALAVHGTVSIDTMKRQVALASVSAGASIINDVSASLFQTAAECGVGWIAMHMQGSPRSMQLDPHYDDVVGEVSAFLAQQVERADAAGVAKVWIDPGIGFGKTLENNVALLHALAMLGGIAPVMLGVSRKSFLGKLGQGAEGADRDRASAELASWAATQHVAMVRVHDVAGTVAALRSPPPIAAPPWLGTAV